MQEKAASRLLGGACGGGSRCSRCSRGGGGGCGHGAGARPRIGAVEARTLEHHTHGVELLAQRAATFGADGQRVVGERLLNVEGVAAILAGVSVSGHWVSSWIHAWGPCDRTKTWQSMAPSANSSTAC